MKLDIGGDDDLRYVRREKVPDRTPDLDAVKCCFVALKNHPPKQNPAIWKPTSLRRAPLGALTSVRNLYRVWKVLFWHGDLRKERTYPLTRTQVIKSTLDHSIGRERFFELDGNEAPTLRFASLSQHDTGALCDHPRRSERTMVLTCSCGDSPVLTSWRIKRA
jgi:hypothetical protein